MEKKFFRFLLSLYIGIFLLIIILIIQGYVSSSLYYTLLDFRKEYVWRTSKLIFDEYVKIPIKETGQIIIDYEKALLENKQYPWLTENQVREMERDGEKYIREKWCTKDSPCYIVYMDELYDNKIEFLKQEKDRFDWYNKLYNFTYEEANSEENRLGSYLPIEWIEIYLWLRSSEINYYDYQIFWKVAYDFISEWKWSLKEVFDKKNIDRKYKNQEIIPYEFRDYENNGSIRDKVLKNYNSNPGEINIIIEEQQNLLDKEINKFKLNFFLSYCLKPIFFVILGYYIIQIVVLLRFVNFILNWWKKNSENKRKNTKNSN